MARKHRYQCACETSQQRKRSTRLRQIAWGAANASAATVSVSDAELRRALDAAKRQYQLVEPAVPQLNRLHINERVGQYMRRHGSYSSLAHASPHFRLAQLGLQRKPAANRDADSAEPGSEQQREDE